jgi:hypothetical protein
MLQLSKAPQPVLVVVALIVAGSIIPVVKVSLASSRRHGLHIIHAV